jgi:hypothetical protein
MPSIVMALVCAAFASGCSKGNASFIGTFRMGERVQAGSLVYQVLESDWRSELGSAGRTPKNRYMFVKLSITNTSSNTISVPTLMIEGAGQTYPEVTEDMDKVDNWLGLLRNIGPSQTEQGWIVFDAPMAAYKLVVTDAGEIGHEKSAHVEIPVQLE